VTSKNQSKRPRPSYEEGELRDETIAAKQNGYKKGDLKALIKKAVKAADKPNRS
jgi:hypothetical protein